MKKYTQHWSRFRPHWLWIPSICGLHSSAIASGKYRVENKIRNSVRRFISANWSYVVADDKRPVSPVTWTAWIYYLGSEKERERKIGREKKYSVSLLLFRENDGRQVSLIGERTRKTRTIVLSRHVSNVEEINDKGAGVCWLLFFPCGSSIRSTFFRML